MTTAMITKEAYLALALRESLLLPARPDLNQLAQELRLVVVEADTESFDGALLRSQNGLSGRILVKKTMREDGRKRFTIAHEIGHFVLHRERQISCFPGDIARWENTADDPERQADNFAAELLMPSPEVVKQIGDASPSFQLIISLADYFGTTLTATGRRYCEVTPYECAMVWSVDGTIRWMHPSSRFRHWIGIGRALSEGTMARQMLDGDHIPTGMREVPAGEWISDYRLPDGATIWEESRTMPFYKACLTLLWARREITYRDSAQDELLREMDPQEFTLERKTWPTKGKHRR
jgi:IrrE N-terminal-like domain